MTEGLEQQRGGCCFVWVELETYNLTIGVWGPVSRRGFGSLQNPEPNPNPNTNPNHILRRDTTLNKCLCQFKYPEDN